LSSYGCCCTVIDVGTTVSPAESHPALATLIPMCTVYGETPVQTTVVPDCFLPSYPPVYNTNLSTLNPCNSTELTRHVLTNCQHVSLIMILAKSNHVATVVAGIDLLVKVLSLLRLHCYHQWNEGFECSFQQHSKLWQTLAKQS
jgi:hypothetical protein